MRTRDWIGIILFGVAGWISATALFELYTSCGCMTADKVQELHRAILKAGVLLWLAATCIWWDNITARIELAIFAATDAYANEKAELDQAKSQAWPYACVLLYGKPLLSGLTIFTGTAGVVVGITDFARSLRQ
jgi:hypothetical protein